MFYFAQAVAELMQGVQKPRRENWLGRCACDTVVLFQLKVKKWSLFWSRSSDITIYFFVCYAEESQLYTFFFLNEIRVSK